MGQPMQFRVVLCCTSKTRDQRNAPLSGVVLMDLLALRYLVDARWEDINQSEFETLAVSERWRQDLQDDMIQHIQALLAGTNSFLRDDYREVAQPTPVLLEVAPSCHGSADQALTASPGGW